MEQPELSATDLYLTNDYTVQVTLIGKDLDPAEVSTILPLTPSTAARRGEQRPTANGSEAHAWEHGVWSHEVNTRDDVNECRDHQILCMVDEIEPRHEDLRRAGVDRIYFYYTLASSIGMMNIRLRPETMRRLADIEADLYISCFDCFDPSDRYWKDS